MPNRGRSRRDSITEFSQHVRKSTKETNDKKALKIAEEFERAAKTKRTLKQVQKVLDRLHEEVSGERIVRPPFAHT